MALTVHLLFRGCGALLLLVSGVFCQAGTADQITGRWYTENNEAIFSFFKSGDTYRARLTPLRNSDLKDTLNPVDSLKARPLDSMVIVSGLIYNKNKNQWEGGTVYNPSDGKSYTCQCRLFANETKMLFRGYIGISLFGGTQVFSRIIDK